jgi:hypothetical protein
MENFTKISLILFTLLWKVTKFFWTYSCYTSFKTLKENISIALVLRGTYWFLPFHMSMDASDTTIRVVLGQDRSKKCMYLLH